MTRSDHTITITGPEQILAGRRFRNAENEGERLLTVVLQADLEAYWPVVSLVGTAAEFHTLAVALVDLLALLETAPLGETVRVVRLTDQPHDEGAVDQ